jgi:1-acyl-sn-glycerol-3-phosphate acyltransferase
MRDLLHRQWNELRRNLRPREWVYWLLQNLLLLVVKFRMGVQMYGGENYSPPAPATLLLNGHKRDWDIPVLTPRLYYHRGWWRPDERRMAFAGREDIFIPGFAVELVGGGKWPRWMQRRLEHLSFESFLLWMRTYPIVRVREFTLHQYLVELQNEQGDLCLSEVFSDEMLERLDRWGAVLDSHKRSTQPRPSRELRISDIRDLKYRKILMPYLRQRFLLPERYTEYKERQRGKIARQLQTLADVLKEGDTLWLAPEGTLTPNGSVGRSRDGLALLLNLMPPGTRTLPTNICYDFMAAGRMRACVAIGPALPIRKGLSRAELLEQVRVAIALQTVVTMSMLGSTFLWERLQQEQPAFDFETALSAILQRVEALSRQSALLERGLKRPAEIRKRLRSFLRYSYKKGLLIRQPDHNYQVQSAPFQQEYDHFFWRNPRYCVNELAALEAALVESGPGALKKPELSWLWSSSAQNLG